MFERSFIDKALPIPIYYQLQQQIHRLINEGKLKEGMKLPTEKELCQIYDISRMTVRQVYDSLLKMELIYREKGKGTFISSSKLNFELSRLHSFSEEMVKRKLHVENKLLNKTVIKASTKLQGIIKVGTHAEILVIKRLRIVQNVPMAIETSHVPLSLCPGLEEENFIHGSLFGTLSRKYKLDIHNSSQTLEPVLSNREDSALLNIKIGSPLIQVDGISYLKNGAPIEYIIGLYRGDRYKFTLKLTRKKT